MKLKKILSFAMAGMLATVLMAPSAGAAKNTTRINATCRLPEIRVTVPSTGRAYINPLKIPVTIGSGEEDSGQIVSVPKSIANNSEVPIIVNVTVTGTVKVGSDMTLASSTTQGTSLTSKKAFVYFEMKSAGPDDDLNSISWDSTYDPDKHVLVRGTKKKEGIIQLAAADENGDAVDGGVGAFHFAGDAVENPKSSWNKRDGVNVEVAFTFTPVSLLE